MKVAIFDMDGTLIDSMHYWHTVALEFLRERGFEPTQEICDKSYLMSVRDAPKLFRQYYDIAETDDEYNERVNQIMFRHYDRDVTLKPYADEYLKHLRSRGIICVLATATWRPITMPLIERLGIRGYFTCDGCDYMVCRDEMGMSKASDEYYPTLLNKFGFDASDCVMFEDALYSMRTAKRAGLKVCAIEEETAAANINEIKRLADRYIHGWRELVDGE